MIENTIIKKNKQGKKGLTLALTFPSTQMVEFAAQAGFDAINLDGEHGAFTAESVDLMCRLANAFGMSVTARVPNIEPATINLWLDRGIQGVTGPHIETKAEAQALADACLFPPDGQRSWGGGRGTELGDMAKLDEYGGKLGFAKWTNQNMLVFGQIESKKAWDNLDEILSVPGLTGVTGGPHDFAASLGHPGEPEHQDRQKATEDVEKRARAAGKVVAGDLTSGMAVQELMLRVGREFVEAHKDDKVGG